jgi:hypothetical protein
VSEREVSPLEAWQAAKDRLAGMSDSEKVQTLKDSGILTATGKLTMRYRGSANGAK